MKLIRRNFAGFEGIEKTGIGWKIKICYTELRGSFCVYLCFIFFSNKRHRHTLLRIVFFPFFSWEKKKRHRFEAAPSWYCLFAFFFRTVPPHLQLFPSFAAAPAGFSFIPSSLRPHASLVCTSATYFHARFAAARQTVLGREWLCTLTVLAVKEDKERSLTPSKGWDFIPNTYGWDERAWGWSPSFCLAI